MRRGSVTWLIALAVVALVVESVNVFGFWSWKAFVDDLAIDPNAAAERMATSAGFSLPSTVSWSRQLSARDLAAADASKIVFALDRLGLLQKKWFVTDPNGPKNLARACLLRGDIDGAVENLRAALVRDPQSPYLHRLFAMVLRQVGDPLEVLEHLAIAAGLSPGIKNPPVDLLPEDETWVRQEGMRRRLELYPRQRVSGLIALAKDLRREGKSEEAWQALAEVEDEADVMLVTAEWNIKDGNYAEAASRLEVMTSNRLYPKSVKVRAWSLAAQAFDLDEQPERARSAAEQALRLEPESASPYLALASIAQRRGDHEAAFKYLRTARGVDPTNISLLTRLARAAEKTGHESDARSALERAVEIDPGNASLASTLVDYHLRRGDFMAAAMLLSRFLEKFPMDTKLLRQAERLRNEVSR